MNNYYALLTLSGIIALLTFIFSDFNFVFTIFVAMILGLLVLLIYGLFENRYISLAASLSIISIFAVFLMANQMAISDLPFEGNADSFLSAESMIPKSIEGKPSISCQSEGNRYGSFVLSDQLRCTTKVSYVEYPEFRLDQIIVNSFNGKSWDNVMYVPQEKIVDMGRYDWVNWNFMLSGGEIVKYRIEYQFVNDSSFTDSWFYYYIYPKWVSGERAEELERERGITRGTLLISVMPLLLFSIFSFVMNLKKLIDGVQE